MHVRARDEKGSLGCLFHLNAGIFGRVRRSDVSDRANKAGE
jgi:hypothetical protein